jgi:hypothetical protein
MMDNSNPAHDRNFKREEPDAILFGTTAHTHDISVQQLRDGLFLVDVLRAILAAKGGVTPDLGFQTQASVLAVRTNTERAHVNMRYNDIVGLFYSASSSRSPQNNNGRSYYNALTTPIPEARRADLALIGEVFRQHGDTTPWITTALWSENGQLVTPGSWTSFMEHGGWMIERLLMEHRSALRGYQRVYGLTDTQVGLAASIYGRRMARPRDWLLLTEEDFQALIADGHAGLQSSTHLLLNQRIHQPYRLS